MTWLNRFGLLVLLSTVACAYHNPTAPTPAAADLTSPVHLNLEGSAGTGDAAGTAAIVATVTNSQGTSLADVAVGFSQPGAGPAQPVRSVPSGT